MQGIPADPHEEPLHLQASFLTSKHSAGPTTTETSLIQTGLTRTPKKPGTSKAALPITEAQLRTRYLQASIQDGSVRTQHPNVSLRLTLSLRR